MGTQYLIDTNVIIDFSKGTIPADGNELVAHVIDTEPTISFINKIELLGFSSVSNAIIEFSESANTLMCTEDIIKLCIDIRKQKKIKLPDAIIAATAISSGRILLTRNTSDFSGIDGLTVINPHNLPPTS
ncbi:MAG: type II toxin-antitoxin system VapC family toxin [Bacteroidia bacterium]